MAESNLFTQTFHVSQVPCGHLGGTETPLIQRSRTRAPSLAWVLHPISEPSHCPTLPEAAWGWLWMDTASRPWTGVSETWGAEDSGIRPWGQSLLPRTSPCRSPQRVLRWACSGLQAAHLSCLAQRGQNGLCQHVPGHCGHRCRQGGRAQGHWAQDPLPCGWAISKPSFSFQTQHHMAKLDEW